MKNTKDSDIALMHLQDKVQYTGELLFSQEQVYSIMQDSNCAKHIRVMGWLYIFYNLIILESVQYFLDILPQKWVCIN